MDNVPLGADNMPNAPWKDPELKSIEVEVVLLMDTLVPVDQDEDELKQEIIDQVELSLRFTDFYIGEILIK